MANELSPWCAVPLPGTRRHAAPDMNVFLLLVLEKKRSRRGAAKRILLFLKKKQQQNFDFFAAWSRCHAV
jgi:hypothetical protein